MSKIVKYFVFFLFLCTGNSCKEITAPVLTTNEVREISYTSATAGGEITGDGGASIVRRGVCWSTVTGPTINDSIVTEAGSAGKFTCSLTKLIPNTTYYLRAFATNVNDVGYGNEVTFNTLQNTIPVLTTTAVTFIGPASAASGGNITSDGGLQIISRGVCWATTQEPVVSGNKTEDGEGKGVFASSITGLSQGTTYFVRAYATNIFGTGYGAAVTFTTLAPPAVSTEQVTGLTQTSVVSGGEVTSTGGADVTARGVCWSTSPDPTTELSTKTSDGTGTGTFSSSITGLTLNTTYYARAYATNSVGTSYGSQVTFTTIKENQVADAGNNVYDMVTIGTQTWLKENLRTGKYSNGDQISNITGTSQWQNASTGAWRYYNDDSQYNSVYGKLYNWQTIADSRKVCPSGWHVPTDTEWKTLESYLGMDPFEINITDYRGGNANVGGKLKKVDATLWNSPNTGANDQYGFSAIPGGRYNYDGTFTGVKSEGAWWSSTLAIPNTNLAWLRMLSYSNYGIYRSMPDSKMTGGGFSIRCIKD